MGLNYEFWNPIFTKWQVPLFLLLYLILIIVVIFSLYKKYFFITILMLLIDWQINSSGLIWKSFSDFQIIRDKEICNDINYCKAVSIPGLTQESCLSRDGAWNVSDQGCDISFEMTECYQKEGHWIYPELCNKTN